MLINGERERGGWKRDAHCFKRQGGVERGTFGNTQKKNEEDELQQCVVWNVSVQRKKKEKEKEKKKTKKKKKQERETKLEGEGRIAGRR